MGHGVGFRLLGPVDVTVDGRVVEIGSAKQRALLASLVLRVGTVVPVEVLVDHLWGESPPAAVAGTLQSLVSRLRGILADGARLRSRSGGYVLEAASADIDVVQFERLVAAGRQSLVAGETRAAADSMSAALALWRGSAFGDLADRPFACDEARRLEEARLGAVEDLGDALLSLERPQEALDRLETHIAQHPLRERAWAQMMLALYRVGRQADALHAFRRLRRVLADELGVEPMPQLRRLAEQILHHAPDLHPGAAGREQVSHHNLPVALTSWIGRKQELDDVVTALDAARLLTLTGPGGSGKTRLAQRAAAHVLDRFPDGVWLVELAPVRDPGLVLDEVVTAVGLLPAALTRGRKPLQQSLCEQLGARTLLLVLDNCEHVVETTARLVHAVLTRCPHVAVLATSREVLDVPGETVWKVPPLSVPPAAATSPAELVGSDAVALFCERAREARPGFGLSEVNAAAVARICRRLDGIPLALELAAGRIRMLGADQVADRLDDCFRLLSGGSRVVEERHRTLRATMDWSYALLPPAEQALLRGLAVFRGTFTLTAVEAVVGDAHGEVLGLLTRLVDKSLVTVVGDEPEVRYGLLEIVREYARLRLGEAGETEAAHTRLRDHFLAEADRWVAAADYWNWWWWLRRLDADHDNFAVALEWSAAGGHDEELLRLAVAHWPYWYWGETLGWRRWLAEAVERCPTPSPARVEALIALASLLMRSGEDSARSHALFAEARAVATSLPGGQAVAQVDFYRAHALLAEDEPKAAEDLLRGALRRSTNADFLGWCHWCLGSIALATDRLEEAATEHAVALEMGDRVGDESLRAHGCSALALIAALRDDPVAAAAMALRAVRSAERMVGAPRVLLMALAHAGQAAVLTGAPGAAASVSRLLGMLRDRGLTDWTDEALDVAALVLADRLPADAATALCASRPVGAGDGRLTAMRDRLVGCRARIEATLGPERWAACAGRTGAMPLDEAIVHVLSALAEESR